MSMLRQDKMTPDERWVALLNRKPVDRVPIVGMARGFAALNVGYAINDLYSDAKKAFDACTWIDDMYGWQHRQHTLQLGALGKEVRMPTNQFSQAPSIVRPLVETEEELWSLRFPPARMTAGVAMECAKLVVEHGSPFATFATSIFSLGSTLPGLETFCRWMIRKPEFAHHLMRVATDYALDNAQYYADTLGPEHVMPYHGEPSAANQIISPKLFEEFALPYIKDFYQKIQAMGIKHSMVHICGEHNLNLPLWAKVHMGDPAIISFGHEIDLGTASEYFPNDIIMGNVEPAIIQFGTSDEVYELSRTCVEKGKKHEAGYILAPGCELPPKAPPYNVWQMTKAVNDWGWYE